MDFSLSEEQQLLQTSIQRFISEQYAFEIRNQSIEQHGPHNASVWQQFAELGWLHMLFDERDEGLSGTACDLMLMMEEFGKGLVTEPFLANIILSGALVKRAGNPALKQTLLPKLMAGELQLASCLYEKPARFDAFYITSQATATDGRLLINGSKTNCYNAKHAHQLIVSAVDNEQKIGLYLVDLASVNEKQVIMQHYQSVDDFDISEVHFASCPARPLNENDFDYQAVLQQALNDALLAVCAEAVGIIEAAYKATVEYCKTREQFGLAISNFQVLQHRMVDMFIEHEQCKSLLIASAISLRDSQAKLAEPSASEHLEASRNLSALKAKIGKAARYVSQQSVQLHGGMGMTDELIIGHYFKRLTMIEQLFGNTDFHLRQYTRLSA